MTDQTADTVSNPAPHPANEQPLLFDLPTDPPRDAPPIANSQPKPRAKRRAGRPVKSRPTNTDLANNSGDEPASCDAQIVFVDPFLIESEPFNGRGLATFDPDANHKLIEDMRIRGNTVPVRLRPNRERTGWTCASGSRRVNSARIIAADQPAFRIAAIIDDAMTDADAYALCLADNHGRSDVTPMQRGREMKWAITHLHGGDRKAYIQQHGVDASVVSRALDLVDLPEPILACAADREILPTVRREAVAPAKG